MMTTPVLIVTGIDEEPMAATALSLQCDLPGAATVHHRLDQDAGTLTRVVSDWSGELDREVISLDHACVTCAIREDVLPTLERLAGRFPTLIAHLPMGAQADQVCRALATERHLSRRLRVGAVVAALAGQGLADDLLGEQVFSERGPSHGSEDDRGVGETACAMVEYADLIVAGSGADPTGLDLVRTLARRDATLVDGAHSLSVDQSILTAHSFHRTVGWVDPLSVPGADPIGHTWQLTLTSPHPFHPVRLLEDLEAIGSGRHRTRGVFWLPTRPGDVQIWDGAGGQLSIGNEFGWGRTMPHTRLLFTGIGEMPTHLERVFASLLLQPDEAASRRWDVAEDGFEPWLGDIRDIA